MDCHVYHTSPSPPFLFYVVLRLQPVILIFFPVQVSRSSMYPSLIFTCLFLVFLWLLSVMPRYHFACIGLTLRIPLTRHRRPHGRPETSRSRDRLPADADVPDYHADDATETLPAPATEIATAAPPAEPTPPAPPTTLASGTPTTTPAAQESLHVCVPRPSLAFRPRVLPGLASTPRATIPRPTFPCTDQPVPSHPFSTTTPRTQHEDPFQPLYWPRTTATLLTTTSHSTTQ